MQDCARAEDAADLLNPPADYLEELNPAVPRPAPADDGTRPRLCACPLICFQQVFGDEMFCDFCNEFEDCECSGNDMGVDRRCCDLDDYGPDDTVPARPCRLLPRSDAVQGGARWRDGGGDGEAVARCPKPRVVQDSTYLLNRFS